MFLRALSDFSLRGAHVAEGETIEVSDPHLGRSLVLMRRCIEVPAPVPEPTPPEVVESRDPDPDPGPDPEPENREPKHKRPSPRK